VVGGNPSGELPLHGVPKVPTLLVKSTCCSTVVSISYLQTPTEADKNRKLAPQELPVLHRSRKGIAMALFAPSNPSHNIHHVPCGEAPDFLLLSFTSHTSTDLDQRFPWKKNLWRLDVADKLTSSRLRSLPLKRGPLRGISFIQPSLVAKLWHCPMVVVNIPLPCPPTLDINATCKTGEWCRCGSQMYRVLWVYGR
jgi:hypothetical protein